MRRPTASAITSGGSVMYGNFNRIIRSGNFASGCAKFWSKSFARLRTIDVSRWAFLAETPLMSCRRAWARVERLLFLAQRCSVWVNLHSLDLVPGPHVDRHHVADPRAVV